MAKEQKVAAKESKTARITKLVDHAVAMQAVLKDAQLRLDEDKAQLRALAQGEFTTEQTKVIYAGSSGVAEVVYVADKAKIAKGANPRLLVGGPDSPLTSEEWAQLFVEEVKLAPEFLARLDHMPTSVRKAVWKMVGVEACEPRVTVR